MRYLNELRDGEMVTETYLCKSKLSLQTKAGKNYFSLVLQDKSGSMDAKIWDMGPGIENFDAMDYVHVDGQVTLFQGSPQLNIRRLRKCREGEYDQAEYMPCTKKNVEEMYKELTGYISSVKNKYLKQLLEDTFVKDRDMIAKFKQHSAAKMLHHGFVGGLLEHTLGVTRLCAFAADTYPIINKDLLLAAAMFHDIGKLTEISPFPENGYTDEGELLGHIYIGAQYVEEKAKQIEGFPVNVRMELVHCILAHHGELEYGSPKKPAIVEALVLSMMDNLDAKVENMSEILEDVGPNKWTGFQKSFESNIRRTGE